MTIVEKYDKMMIIERYGKRIAREMKREGMVTCSLKRCSLESRISPVHVRSLSLIEYIDPIYNDTSNLSKL